MKLLDIILERDDSKNFMEMATIYRLFQIKLKNREFSQREYMKPKGFDLSLSMTLETEFGDLILQLTEQRSGGWGQYAFINENITPKIILFNCQFKLSEERHVNKNGFKTIMKQIVGIQSFNPQALKHEIVHFIDDKKKRKLDQKPNMSRKEWHNDTFEINAEFISVLNQIKNKKDYSLPSTFDEFLKLYINFNPITQSQWTHLVDKKRKSLISRIYQYYTYLVDKQKEEQP
jgi:hypothetical protein